MLAPIELTPQSGYTGMYSPRSGTCSLLLITVEQVAFVPLIGPVVESSDLGCGFAGWSFPHGYGFSRI